MLEYMFSYSKTGPAPVGLDSGNYSSIFYLVTLNEEIDCDRKYRGTKECKLNTPSHLPPLLKVIICRIEKCECVVHF